jgi:serine/threonine-protein kinase HipA
MNRKGIQKIVVSFTKSENLSFEIGTLIQKNGDIFFEYNERWIERGIELSPLSLPLKKHLFKFSHYSFGSIFGLFDDSLPDGWGLMLMDRYFRKNGINPSTMSVLDRLSFMGNNTMGALTYYPCDESSDVDGIFNFQELAEISKKIYNGDSSELIPQLLRAGGSPGGARPKILAGYNSINKKMISGEIDLPENYEHYIIKFFGKDDFSDSGKLEYVYSLMAKDAGILMSETRLFDCDNGESYFGIKRFDRLRKNERLHIHSFGNLIESNFRIPSSDYLDLLKITLYITKNQKDVLKVFKLMIFNILVHNRDDHVKNFSFIFDENKKGWKFAPAYDLTFSEGIGGEHSMTINGEGKSPSLKDILKIAKDYNIKKSIVFNIIDEISNVTNNFEKYSSDIDLTKSTEKIVNQELIKLRKNMK